MCNYIRSETMKVKYTSIIQVSQVPNLPVLIDKFRRND